MVKLELELGDVQRLHGELATLGTEELPMSQKYWINRLRDQTESIVKRIEKSRIELVKKHGAENPVSKELEVLHNTEGAKLFQAEIEVLFEQKEVLEHKPFPFEDYQFKTKNNYFVFMNKILSPPVEPAEKVDKPKKSAKA